MLYNTIVSKTKKIIISVSVVSVAIILSVVSLLLVYLYKPKPAEGLQIKTQGSQIYVCVEPVEERTYKFKFVNGEEEKVFDSVSSQFDITNLLWSGELSFGTDYQISFCLVEPTGILDGEYSKAIIYTPTIRLQAPTVNVSEQNVLSWESVQGADYYNLYYYDAEELVKIKVEQTSFDLTQIKGGERKVYVTSNSNQSFFFESNPSNVIESTVIHNIAAFEEAFIDQTYTLHIISPEKIDGVELVVGEEVFTVTQQNLTIEEYDGKFEITFSVNQIFKPGLEITVKPLGNDFNTYSGEPTLVSMPF